MEEELCIQAENNPLFAGVERDVLLSLVQKADVCAYAAGALLSAPGDAVRRLGLLLSGEAQVYKRLGEGLDSLPMSTLCPGSLLGAATLFLPGACAVTEIRARKPCRVLFFAEAELERAMQASFVLTRNYLRYLTARVHFLTERIENIACPTAADKLLNYLTQSAENGAVRLPRGMGMLADSLCMSRASLYRVADDLVRAGKIRREEKTIYIL